MKIGDSMNNNTNNNEENHEKFNWLYTGWFLVSMVACFFLFFSPYDYLMKLAYGQFFLINGLVVCFTGNTFDIVSSTMFIVGGLAFILIPTLTEPPEILTQNIGFVTVLTVSIILIVVGIVFIVRPLKLKKKMEKGCNIIVYSTIKFNQNKKYSLEYDDKNYKVSESFYTNIITKKIGNRIELNINLYDNKFLSDNNNVKKMIIFGILWLMLVLPIFFFVITH
jgi:hypothetical protein